MPALILIQLHHNISCFFTMSSSSFSSWVLHLPASRFPFPSPIKPSFHDNYSLGVFVKSLWNIFYWNLKDSRNHPGLRLSFILLRFTWTLKTLWCSFHPCPSRNQARNSPLLIRSHVRLCVGGLERPGTTCRPLHPELQLFRRDRHI